MGTKSALVFIIIFFQEYIMNFKSTLSLIAISAFMASSVNASDIHENTYNTAFDIFTDAANGWTEVANDDGILEGRGKQAYDTEYLFTKQTGSLLSIGLQTGFDLSDNRHKDIYGGDIALRFTNSDNSILGPVASNGDGYNFAIDFGKRTKDQDGNKLNANAGSNGYDAAGLYSVSQWNNNITFQDEAAPFAMDEGTIISGLTENILGEGETKKFYHNNNAEGSGYNPGSSTHNKRYSYYRIVTFDLSTISGLSQNFTVDAHWTMSCGNDHINTGFNASLPGGGGSSPKPVPEPSIIALFGLGMIGLFASSGIRRRKK